MMTYSRGFFDRVSSSGAAHEKTTTEDAAYLAGDLEGLEKRVTQIMNVKQRSESTSEVTDCQNAIQTLAECCEKVLEAAHLNHSPRPK